MRINRSVRAELDMPEVLSFDTDSRNYENLGRRKREIQEPIFFHFMYIRQSMRINRIVIARLDRSEVLSLHTDSRNCENSKPWVTEARTPRNVIMSHIFANL